MEMSKPAPDLCRTIKIEMVDSKSGQQANHRKAGELRLGNNRLRHYRIAGCLAPIDVKHRARKIERPLFFILAFLGTPASPLPLD